MKVTQYFTTNGTDFLPQADFLQRPVFVSQYLNGVKALRRSSKIISTDFLGFGVAITGSSCYNLAQLPKEQRESFLQSVYGKDGLGLDIGRLSIGSSDYSAEIYSYDDMDGDTELKHFSIEKDEKYIIPMIKEILKINPDLYLYASPWSPPAWMKTGGSIGGGFMRREFIDCYAEYIVRFIKEYAKRGIKISALTPQNEPGTHQAGRMPACIWHPDIEAEFVIALRKKLQKNNLDVKIWLFDHNFSQWKRVKWTLDAHRELQDACDGIAFHYYKGAIEGTRALKKAYPALPIHFTEGGPRLYDHYATDCCKWGTMICKALNCGYSSFTGWNLMLDEYGGPNVGPFFCGGLVTRNSVSNELSYSGQYKAFQHISRFMQKGAGVYEVEMEHEPNQVGMSSFPCNNPLPLEASCIKNSNGTTCYLLTNSDKEKQQVQIFEGGEWYYVEVLPYTLCTVVFEEEKDENCSE
ncbi:MAG: hypothetical protein IJX39_06855 [Clostridia bacterium]|nr:hypothetical protein [Clostridia bacterium]